MTKARVTVPPVQIRVKISSQDEFEQSFPLATAATCSSSRTCESSRPTKLLIVSFWWSATPVRAKDNTSLDPGGSKTHGYHLLPINSKVIMLYLPFGEMWGGEENILLEKATTGSLEFLTSLTLDAHTHLVCNRQTRLIGLPYSFHFGPFANG